MDSYFSGSTLYGNDLGADEIIQWFEDEKEGYYGLDDRKEYVYGYAALNKHHGFRHLPKKKWNHVLGFGSAFGHELEPVEAEKFTILEPSDGFQNPMFSYVKPHWSGILPFADASFDLIVCLGVLHHIPNVRTVLEEMGRVLTPGGYALIREPIISMGDWRNPRKGLTKRERGIPLPLLRQFMRQSGLEILRQRKCVFSLTSRLRYVIRGPVYNSALVVKADALLCRLPIWPTSYHPRVWIEKLKPTAAFFIACKPPQAS